MGLQLFDESTPVVEYQEIHNSDGTGYVTLSGSERAFIRWDAIYIGNTDSVDHYVQVAANIGTASAPFGTVHVPAGAGRTNVPAVEFVGLAIPASVGAIVLTSFVSLQARTDVAVGVGEALYFTMQGGSV